MTRRVRILHLEDDPNDTVLLEAALQEAGLPCAIVRAASRPDFESQLESGGWDIIISDFSLPSYDGAEALERARALCPEVPFLYVSGTLGEEAAVAALQRGATDYILKTNLKRLVPSVRRALEEAERRRELSRSQSRLLRAEEQLRQAQKMEAMGRLAGGVAHDFNNLLTAILGYCDLLRSSLKPADPRQEDLKEIIRAAERAAALTRQLLAYSRRQILQPRVLDLNGVIEGMARMLKRVIGEDIQVALSLSPGLGRVKVDPGQIEQVLLNLAVNARDAMPHGGRLSIETANAVLGQASAGRHDVIPPGDYVLLSVGDTGHGMDERILEHLFEPFFTTKGPGKGTGLGLSTVYGIIKQSGGYIEARSAAGQGTRFEAYLPRTQDPPEKIAPAPVRSVLRGDETILLVEDEAPVRNLLARVLGENGYAVLEAQSATKALEMFQRRPASVDLVLTDVVMPDMGGGHLAERLKAVKPDVKVLFMSGYTDEAVLRHGVSDPGSFFLQKPVTPQGLLETIRAVLDAS